jgi:hypothetical protein
MSSFATNARGDKRSGSLKRCVATAGVSIRIVLNFGILKISLPTPTRSDQYNADPLEVSLTKSAMTRMGNNKTGTKQREMIKSNILFMPASL